MRIGVVTTSYPRAPGDPAGSFVEAHVRALRGLGHTVDVIAAGDPDGTDATRIHGDLFDRGGAPDLLEQRPLRSLAGAAMFSARLLAAVVARAPIWDSIIAHWLVPSAIAALPSRAPLLAIAHGGDVHTLRRMHLLGPALHALHLRRAELVFVSDELRAIARAAAPRLAPWLDAAIVQPMGLDLARFTALAPEPTSPPTILVAARLVPIKGVDVAIEAMREVRTPAHLVIAGDGPERSSLEARGAHVTFLGGVDAAHRDRLLGAASLVLVPSRITARGRSEGTPMIALEALAAGVPVVASAVGGLRALAPVVRLVPPDDPTRLAAAIDRILAAPPSRSELRTAVSHLDWAQVAPRLVRTR